MNLLEDLKEIVKNDKEHNLKVEVSNIEVKVYLEYDPENAYDGKVILPITYDFLVESCYIDDHEYREKYNPNDYGIDLNELKLAVAIMEYLESHREEICELCQGFNWADREEKE